MRQTGEYRIGASAQEVWRALNDPEVLQRCIEGCQTMTRAGEDAYAAEVKAKVGPVSALFSAEVRLADLDPPRGYTLHAQVKGGAAGFGKGTARVALTEDGAETVLAYEVEGNVGGKLAQVGQRLIDAAARKMADDFFERFRDIVAPPPPEPAVEAAPAAPRQGWWAALLAFLARLFAPRRAGAGPS